MKKFIIKTSFFLVILISLFTIIYYITNKGLEKSEFGNLKEWKEIFAGEINSHILIHGSSRARVQYSTYIIDSVLNTDSYNMGIDGSPFDIQYLRFKTYLGKNSPPKIILQNVDLDLLDKNLVVFQKYQFLPFLNNLDFKEILYKNGVISNSDYSLPFLRYYGQPKAIQIGFLEYFGIKHFKSKSINGFLSVDKKWDGRNFEKKKKTGINHWKIDPELEKLFLCFLAECKSKNIKVVLVYAPIYYELQKHTLNFTESELYYKNIAKKNGLHFFNYCNDTISFNKKYFYNATHLNSKGAEIFTKKLTKDIKSVIPSLYDYESLNDLNTLSPKIKN